jgi:hypothetical protein
LAAGVLGVVLIIGPSAAIAGSSGGSSSTPAGEIAGNRVHVSGGVTQTVAEIMARQRAQRHSGRRAPQLRLLPGERRTPQGGAGPRVARTPSRPGSHPNIATPTTGTTFLGAQLSESGALPPDSNGDVGPTQVFVDVNGRFKVFDKNGVLGGLNVDPDVFWAPVMTPAGCNFTSDPHVRYDRLAARWFIVMIDVPGCVGDQVNRVMMAVSSGPTITSSSSFTLYQFSAPAGEFADYPTLGVDANALYIGGNMFSTSASFVNTDAWVVRKSDLVAGNPAVVTRFGNLLNGSSQGPLTPQGVDNDTAGATEGYFVGTDGAVFSLLQLRRVSNPGSGSPTISSNLSLTVPTTTFPENVPASGTSTRLDALDDRLFAAMIQPAPGGGAPRLWTTHNIEVNASGVASGSGSRDGLRWYEIGNLSTTPNLVQSGTVFDSAASNPSYYWIPSIAANGAGQAVIASSTAGTGKFAQIAAAQRFPGDALGFMSAPAIIQTSTFAYDRTDTNPQRWGDYSQTVVDPNDNQTFWTFQEYANATNSWGVQAIQLKAPPPAVPTSTSPASVNAGNASQTVQIIGTSSNDSGFFDPGPDTGGPGYANRIQASVSGGVTVNSVTFNDPTHVTLDLNTTAAPAGNKNVTITNPDGQNATGNNILTVTVDSTPPATPTITATNPVSPSANTSPQVQGNAEAGSTVKVYSTSDCSGTPLGQGTAAQFASPGVGVTVPAGATTNLRATATDTAANASGCSAALAYTAVIPDTNPPETTITKGPKTKTKKKKATFEFNSSEPNSTFQCSVDDKALARPTLALLFALAKMQLRASSACTSPVTVKVKKGKHTFKVFATDPAGNPDPSPATQSWKVKKKKKKHH